MPDTAAMQLSSAKELINQPTARKGSKIKEGGG